MHLSPVLLADGNAEECQAEVEALAGQGLEATCVATSTEALAVLDHQATCELAFIDVALAPAGGLALLDEVSRRYPAVRLVLLARHPEVSSAVDAMRAGATDFLVKPLTGPVLAALLVRLSVELDPVVAPVDPWSSPETWRALVRAANEAIRQHRDAEAWRLARRALALRPDRPQAYLLLGILAERAGDRISGQPFYRAALDIDPTYGPARDNLHRATHPPVRRAPTLDPALDSTLGDGP